MRYQVIVGNIGTVLETDNGFLANRVYGEYKSLSEAGIGRAGGESVVLMDDGEPKWEYVGTVDQEDET